MQNKRERPKKEKQIKKVKKKISIYKESKKKEMTE